MEFHEAANIFPLDEDSLPALAADIGEHGLKVPIETLDGKILDGRRRFKACAIAGVEPEFRAVKTKDPVAYVLSLNLHRRHLNESQRGMIAARAANLSQGGDRRSEDFKVPTGTLKNTTAAEAADRLDVGERTVKRARKVIAKGTESVVAAVDDGKLPLRVAEKIVDLPEQEQEKTVKEKTSPKKRRKEEEPEPETNGEIEVKGVGIVRAHEAINCLSRIPKNDALRKRGFQVVKDWIRQNERK